MYDVFLIRKYVIGSVYITETLTCRMCWKNKLNMASIKDWIGTNQNIYIHFVFIKNHRSTHHLRYIEMGKDS